MIMVVVVVVDVVGKRILISWDKLFLLLFSFICLRFLLILHSACAYHPAFSLSFFHCLSIRMSRINRLLRKLEVENEPELSNAQLMLMNSDLRPGEIVEEAT